MKIMRLLAIIAGAILFAFPAAAQVSGAPGVPKSFLPSVCASPPASTTLASICVNDGNGRALPFLIMNPAAHTILTPPTADVTAWLQTFFAAGANSCDTSQWTNYIAGSDGVVTQSPQPKCFATKISTGASIPFPAVVGIGDAAGASVPVNSQTYVQYAQGLIQSQTSMDNNHQESGLAINFLSKTGGGGLVQTLHNQKVALYIPTLAIPGASNTWSINDDLVVLSGVGNYSMYRHEGDFTNFNGDYAPGGCNPCASGKINGSAVGDFLTFTGYPITAAFLLAGDPNPGSASMHYGMLFGAAGNTNTVGQGLISDATINDSTNAYNSLALYGNHTVGLNGTLGNTQFLVSAKAGSNICLDTFSACFSSTNHLLQFADGGHFDLQIIGGTSVANGVQIQASGSGFGPIISPFGTDTNAPLNLRGLGNAPVAVLGSLTASGDASLQRVGFNGQAPAGRQNAPATLATDGSASNAALASSINLLSTELKIVGLLQ